jgi:hypothetical protein
MNYKHINIHQFGKPRIDIMSFTATIDDTDNKLFFCRVIGSLSQFNNSEEIKFTITSKNLKLSVFNKLRTSYDEVIIDKEFFGAFDFQSDGFDDEGVVVETGDRGDDGDHVVTGVSYSFLVRSRILGMLFKYDSGIDSYKLSVSIEEGNENHLKIEIRNKNLIRKEYNPFYVPFKDEKLNISKEYKAALRTLMQRQYSNDDYGKNETEEINYLVISNSILKGFLDNVSQNTEDFKIEVNSKKFSMTGYTKKVNNKEEQFLKQSMAVNISFRTDELIDFKLFNDAADEEKKVVFRLKDFKNFLSLGQSNQIIEVWFKRAGDPILFEMNRFKSKLQFIQLTDSDENDVASTAKVTKLFKSDIVVNTERLSKKKAEKNKESLFVQEEEEEDTEVQAPIYDEPARDTETPDSYDEEPIVEWNGNDDNDIQPIKHNDSKQMIKEMKEEYLQNMNKRQKILEDGDDELGPTQNITKIRGIFD